MDFNSLSWHTIFLVGGGNVLGKAVSSSGLLRYISTGITAGERRSFVAWRGVNWSGVEWKEILLFVKY